MILVTGGAGFIGSTLVRRLVAAGDKVRVLDNLSSGFRRNLDGIGDSIEFLGADVCDPEAVSMAVRGVRAIIHLAAIPSVA
ncbi:MAG: SDR family NAD(P)-dependent oxidoreductase, partial [Planctomycetes bacterium]|nr:SDR family NAD(P)-dependent oxidoreductase [Planctomycetota bacterium]